MNKQQLAAKIWESANRMRSTIEANEYKDYILGFIFYKYLSDKEVRWLHNNDYADEDIREYVNEDDPDTVQNVQQSLGYFIAYKDMFSTWIDMKSDFSVDNVRTALSSFTRLISPSHKRVFEGIFNTLETGLSKLGDNTRSQTKAVSDLIQLIDEIPMDGKQDYDVLGYIYEYLIGQFAATAGKKAGEFYTPAGPAELLCRLACDGLTDVKEACDPTCGSGSLLLRLQNYANVRMFYGQELTAQTYNLARMNMILRGVPYRNFQIFNGDTLVNDNFEGHKFRVQVANPPYSAKLANPTAMADDPRYNEYGKLAPASKADFAFVQHMVYHMDDDGRIAVLLPHGVLFRGGAEETIRRYMIEKLNVIDAIIGLPANLFFGTAIPVCVLILRKDRKGNTDNILFIDASRGFTPGKNQNVLEEIHINKIVDAYIKRSEIDGYAHVATISEIVDNDWNLNIPRYVDSGIEIEEIDLVAVKDKLDALREYSKQMETRLQAYYRELGL